MLGEEDDPGKCTLLGDACLDVKAESFHVTVESYLENATGSGDIPVLVQTGRRRISQSGRWVRPEGIDLDVAFASAALPITAVGRHRVRRCRKPVDILVEIRPSAWS
jgi:hypothetical protein